MDSDNESNKDGGKGFELTAAVNSGANESAKANGAAQLSGANVGSAKASIKPGAFKEENAKIIAPANVLIKKEKQLKLCEKCGEIEGINKIKIKKESKKDSPKIKSM